MIRFGIVRSGILAAAITTVSSCGDRTPTGPAAARVQASVTNGFHHRIRNYNNGNTPQNLAPCRPQRPDFVSKSVGRSGGEIEIGPYELEIPDGALSRRVRISARITAGTSVNVVEFKPDGLVFAKPASLSMSYANCDVKDVDAPLRIAVVDDAFQVLYYLPSTTDAKDKEVMGEVAHFTNYAIAW